MKKAFSILFIATSLLFAGITQSKGQTQMTNPNGLALDTATQAAAEGPSLIVKDYQAQMSIELPVTKISGTITGSVAWQGSNDNSKWFTFASDTLTNATNVYGHSEAPKQWLYYRALITQTGTSSLSYKGWLYKSRP